MSHPRALARRAKAVLALVVSLGHAASALAAEPARPADSPAPAKAQGDLRLAPTVGLSFGQSRETARLELDDGSEYRESRSLSNTRLDLGLAYDLLRRTPPNHERLRVRGQSSVGVGVVYFPGDWRVHLRQDFGLELVPKRWFGAFVGLGVGFDIDASRPAYSAFALALPVGLRFGPVEIQYRPAFTTALGGEERAVLGGVQRKSAATGFAPFDLLVRVRIPLRGQR